MIELHEMEQLIEALEDLCAHSCDRHSSRYQGISS